MPGIGIGISPHFQQKKSLSSYWAKQAATKLADGNTPIWLEKDTLVTKDGSNKVSAWADKLLSGTSVVQANGDKQPIWSADGVTFDGVDDLLTCDFVLAQPETVYIVFKVLTWTYARQILGGGATNGGVLYFVPNTANRVSIYAGASLGDLALSPDVWHLVKLNFTGANSVIEIDDWSYKKGNAGTNASGGITIGANYSSDNEANIIVKEIIKRKVTDDSETEVTIKNYLWYKYWDGKKKNILLIGDSITNNMAPYFDVAGDYNVTEIADAGDVITEQASEYSIKVTNKPVFDYIFIMLGMNEAANDLADILSDYQDLIDLVNVEKKFGAKLYVAPITPSLNAARWIGIEDKWAAINEAINGGGASPLTGIDGVVTTLNPLLGDENNYLKVEYDFGDHMHLTEAGYLVMAAEYKKLIV